MKIGDRVVMTNTKRKRNKGTILVIHNGEALIELENPMRCKVSNALVRRLWFPERAFLVLTALDRLVRET